jgi:superfamily II DNA or RNA helicase
MITNLCNNDIRNRIIIYIINILVQQNRTILLLSGRREQLYTFHKLLSDKNLTKKSGELVTFGYYFGKEAGTRKDEHNKMLEETAKKDIVLATFETGKEALDIPSLNTLIFASPPSSAQIKTDNGEDISLGIIEQCIGRILRKVHVDFYPLVIDIIDLFGNFENHAHTRTKYYNSEEYIQHEMSHELEDLSDKAHDKLYDFIMNRDFSNELTKKEKKIKKLIEKKIHKLETIDEDLFKTNLLEDSKTVDKKIKDIKKEKQKLKEEINVIKKFEESDEFIFSKKLI